MVESLSGWVVFLEVVSILVMILVLTFLMVFGFIDRKWR
jgi:ABC-type multidrug transport system permease subunit